MTTRPVRRPDELDEQGAVGAVADSSGRGARPLSRPESMALRPTAEPIDEPLEQEAAASAPAGGAARKPSEEAPDRGSVPRMAGRTRTESWLEQLQQRLEASSRAAARAHEEARAGFAEAVGSFGRRLEDVERQVASTETVEAALKAIARIEKQLSSRPEAGLRDLGRSEFESTMKGVESRIDDLAQRFTAAPRPIGRRGLSPTAEVERAVAEIRSHRDGAARPDGRAERATLPALGSLARSETAILTTLKDDVAKLAHKIDDGLTGARAEADVLKDELGTIRGSIAGAPRQADFDRLEGVIRKLTAEVTEMRLAGQKSLATGELSALRAEIRRLADVAQSTEHAPASGEVEQLSQRLDALASRGVEPEAISGLARQIDDVRQLLANAAAPQALSLVTSHLAELKREVAEVGDRQIDAEQFSSLKSAVEEMRSAISSAPFAGAALKARDTAPLERMLSALVEKVERVEQRVDSDSMDQLEQQIQHLAARIEQEPQHDRTLAALERSMGELMSEVAAWRQGAMELAEAAARNVVEEALGRLPNDPRLHERVSALESQYAANDDRIGAGLLALQGTLEKLVTRIASLESVPPASSAPEPRAASLPAVVPEEITIRPRREDRRVAPEASAEEASRSRPGPSEARVPVAPEDEILLEPGSGRPGFEAPPNSEPSAAQDGPDIKSSFIAAARRAAQAATAEASSPRRGAENQTRAGKLGALSPGELVRHLKGALDRRRRPILLSAAALVLALGTFQILRTATREAEGPSVAVDLGPKPAATRPPGPSTAPPASDPTTTQSIARPAEHPPEKEGASAAAPLPSPAAVVPQPAANTDRTAPATGPSTPEPSPSPAGGGEPLPISPTPGAAEKQAAVSSAAPLPAGVEAAAALGDPVALYELAWRRAEGRGLPRDAALAAQLFEKAASKGLAPAQYRVGNIYEKGTGAARDIGAAKLWYKRAAEAGNTRAMHNLAVLMAETAPKPDYAAAVFWFSRAAEQGLRDSQFNLAVLYARGLGTTQDLVKAYQWLAIAAAQGDADSGRKRDEVGLRLSPADLARAKTAVERWRPAPANAAANEVKIPPGGWPDPAPKRPREARA